MTTVWIRDEKNMRRRPGRRGRKKIGRKNCVRVYAEEKEEEM